MQLYGGSVDEVALDEDDVGRDRREISIEGHVPCLLLEEHLFHKTTSNLEYRLRMLAYSLVASFLDEFIFDQLLSQLCQYSRQELFHSLYDFGPDFHAILLLSVHIGEEFLQSCQEASLLVKLNLFLKIGHP